MSDARLETWFVVAPLASIGAVLGDVPDIAELGSFWCPRCQRTASDRVAHMPAAKAESTDFYRCLLCGNGGARYQLCAFVRRNPEALNRARVAASKQRRRGAA